MLRLPPLLDHLTPALLRRNIQDDEKVCSEVKQENSGWSKTSGRRKKVERQEAQEIMARKKKKQRPVYRTGRKINGFEKLQIRKEKEEEEKN